MTFLIIFHGIICVMLAIIILMQAGRKGGLTEAFASTESMLGTKTNSFMVTATTIFCTLFFITSLILAILSAQKSKSLMTDVAVTPKSQQAESLDAVSKEVDTVKKDAVAAATATKEVVESVIDQAKTASVDVKEAVQGKADQVVSGTSQVVTKVDEAVTSAAQSVVETTNQAVEQVKTTVQEAGQAVNQAVEGITEQQSAVSAQ